MRTGAARPAGRISAEISWIRPYLAIGPRPDGPLWTLLEQAGVTAIIDLNNDPAEKNLVLGSGLRYRGVKVPDPTDLRDFLAAFPVVNGWIDEERKVGGKVYLHCTAGVYRSPTFAMAHQMTNGESPEEAERGVKRVRESTWTTGDLDTLRRALQLWEQQVRTKPGLR